MDEVTKRLVKEAIDEKKEETIKTLKQIMQYPLHPDTRMILLEVRGDGGYFGVNVFQMDEHLAQINKNAYGEWDHDLGGFKFDISKIEDQLKD